MVTRMVKLSATVPKYVDDEIRKIAAASGISRSQLISECLAEMSKRKREILLEEGYRAMARQHKEFALLTQDAAKEALSNW